MFFFLGGGAKNHRYMQNILYCVNRAVSSNHTTAPAAPCFQNHNSLNHFPLRSCVAGVCLG